MYDGSSIVISLSFSDNQIKIPFFGFYFNSSLCMIMTIILSRCKLIKQNNKKCLDFIIYEAFCYLSVTSLGKEKVQKASHVMKWKHVLLGCFFCSLFSKSIFFSCFRFQKRDNKYSKASKYINKTYIG